MFVYQTIDDNLPSPTPPRAMDGRACLSASSKCNSDSDSGSYWVMREPGRERFWGLALPVVPA